MGGQDVQCAAVSQIYRVKIKRRAFKIVSYFITNFLNSQMNYLLTKKAEDYVNFGGNAVKVIIKNL